jgi:hypothetical protein
VLRSPLKAHPNTRRRVHAGVGIRFVIDDGVDSTTTVIWLIERYDALPVYLSG